MPLSVRTPSTSKPTSLRRRATAASSIVTYGRGQGARLSLGPRQPPCHPPGTSLPPCPQPAPQDRKSTRLNSSHGYISYAVFCLKKNKLEIIAEEINEKLTNTF